MRLPITSVAAGMRLVGCQQCLGAIIFGEQSSFARSFVPCRSLRGIDIRRFLQLDMTLYSVETRSSDFRKLFLILPYSLMSCLQLQTLVHNNNINDLQTKLSAAASRSWVRQANSHLLGPSRRFAPYGKAMPPFIVLRRERVAMIRHETLVALESH